MERRLFNRELSREAKLAPAAGSCTGPNTITMQQTKLSNSGVESVRRKTQQQQQQHVPDLTDFMNDMFFGSVKSSTSSDPNRVYNLSGLDDEDEKINNWSASASRKSSRLSHEEWLEEARRMVASSPASPSRLVGSPRFAAVQGGPPQSPSLLDGRDPLSRSARRYTFIFSSLYVIIR